MNVSEIMTKKPTTVQLNTTLHEALEIMERLSCHHLPVLGTNGHLIGILSDRDCRTALNSPHILRERWEDEALATTLPVRAMMTPAPIVIAPEAAAVEAARTMLNNQISCLPVMRDETLVGIVTRSDILLAFMNLTERINRYPENRVTQT